MRIECTSAAHYDLCHEHNQNSAVHSDVRRD
jgi:hypothetical protein